MTLLATTALAVPAAASATNNSSTRTCLTEVPSGSVVLNRTAVGYPDGSVHVFPTDECLGVEGTPPTISGWLADAYNDYSSGFSKVTGQWNVDSAPSNQNDPLIYLFNAMQGDGYIIQPVLTWGCSAYDLLGICLVGGHYWWAAAWSVEGSSATYTQPIQVSQGDQITGTITWFSSSGGRICGGGSGYTIMIDDVTSGHASQLYLCGSDIGGQKLTSANVASLEVYRVNSCNQLPAYGAETFSDITTNPSFSSWTPSTGSYTPNCAPIVGLWGQPSSVTLEWAT